MMLFDEEPLPTNSSRNSTSQQVTLIAAQGGGASVGRRRLAGADVSVTLANCVPVRPPVCTTLPQLHWTHRQGSSTP